MYKKEYLSIMQQLWAKRRMFEFILEQELEEITEMLYVLYLDELKEELGFATDEEKTKNMFYSLLKQNQKDITERMENWMRAQETQLDKKDGYSEQEKIEKILSFIHHFSKYILIIEHKASTKFIREILNPLFQMIYVYYEVERDSVKIIGDQEIDTNSEAFELARTKVMEQINLLARGSLTVAGCMANMAFLKRFKIGYSYYTVLFSKPRIIKIIEIEPNGDLHLLSWEESHYEKASHLPIKKEFFLSLKKQFIAIGNRTKAEKELCQEWKEHLGFWSEKYYLLETREKANEEKTRVENLKKAFQKENIHIAWHELKKERGRLFIPYQDEQIEYHDKKKEKITNWKPIIEGRMVQFLRHTNLAKETIRRFASLMEEIVGVEAEIHVILLPNEEKNEIYIFKNDEKIYSFVLHEMDPLSFLKQF